MNENLKKRSEEINSQIKSLGYEVMEIYKEHGDAPTGDALKAVADKRAQIDTLHEEYLAAKTWEDGKDAVKAHMERVSQPQPMGGNQYGERQKPQVKTIADMVMEDQAFKSWFVEKAKTGGPSGAFRSPSVEGISLKTLLTGLSDTSAGAFIRRDYDSDVMMPMRRLSIRDFITIGNTQSDLVEYVRQTLRTNNAATVAEATATGGASGAAAESAIAFEQATANVEDIVTWVPATRRALSDAGQLASLIDSELRYMVQETFEDKVVDAIKAASGINSQAYATDIVVTARKALTRTRWTGRAVPTAFMFNPNDWEAFEILKDGESRYLLGGPKASDPATLWRLPVVEHERLTSGVGLTGDFRAVKVWDREQTQIFSTDSHADFFIRSINVVLCVARAAIAVKRPASITEIDLTA